MVNEPSVESCHILEVQLWFFCGFLLKEGRRLGLEEGYRIWCCGDMDE